MYGGKVRVFGVIVCIKEERHTLERRGRRREETLSVENHLGNQGGQCSAEE
jgi:hypothetical protein